MVLETRAVTLDTIRDAAARIAPVIHHTPLFTSSTLSREAGCDLVLKAEQYQKTGSFKIRGAYNCLAQLDRVRYPSGVVTASAGNHAQGIAFAARSAELRATVFMPVTASIAKIQATRGYGAEVRLVGAIFDEAVQAAMAHAEETGALFVSAFDHDDIIAGQGTLALELLDDLPDLETAVIPVGGGGLLSGMAIALKEARPSIRVIGVQAEGAPAVVDSFRTGLLQTSVAVQTIADGIAVKYPAERTFRYIKRYVDEMVTVDDEETARTILTLLERQKMVVEGAGAVALAALLGGKVRGSGKTVAVLSGGNIDIKLLSSLLERGMLRANRYVRLVTAVPDRPGEMARVLQTIADLRGNLIEVIHNRISASIPLGSTGVEIQVETRDEAHSQEIVNELRRLGCSVDVAP
ncbi:MAG: threonine ammonia-lyase [bacterium]|nr:threonine ammonia-lyase [bacterium]